MHLFQSSNTAWLGLEYLWVLGSSDEVEPIVFIQTLGVTFTLCLYCYAMLVDVVWYVRFHASCEGYY